MSRRRDASPRGSLRRARGIFALPVALVSGCLLVAPPEDVPALGVGAHGGLGGSAGSGGAGVGGTGASFSGAGGDSEAGEGGRATSGGTGATSGNGANGGTGETGAVGGSARGGSGGGGNGGTAGSAGEGGEPECDTNADCVRKNGGDAARCQSDHTCLVFKNEDCPIAYAGEKGTDRFSDPNAIFVGSMVAMDLDQPNQSTNAWALELAIDEINTAGGLPAPDGGAGRPLVLLVCQSDTSQDADVVKRGITHLGEDVKVQAVVAQLKPDDLLAAFNKEQGRELVYFNAVAISSRLAPHDNNMGLIWTLLGEPKDYAAAYALLLSDLEKYVRAQRGLSLSDELKVAFIYTDDSFNQDLAANVSPTLTFNTLAAESQRFDATTNPDGKYFKVSLSAADPDIQAAVEQIAAFAPDIVISAAGDAMTTSDGKSPDGVIQLLEAAMPTPRPYYILSPYNAATGALNAVETAIDGEFATDSTVAGRFMGVSAAAASDLTLQNKFALRFNTRHQGLSGEVAGQVDNYYDAVYYLADAVYAASLAGDISGPGISAGMKRLIAPATDAARFNDGPDAINDVFAALANSSDDIALYSTLGAPTFNPQTGVRPATPGVYCFTWDAGSQASRHWLDVLRYDADGEKFTGTYECLDNFLPSP